MEQRTLLAIILSCLVIFGYSLLTHPKSSSRPVVNNSQIAGINEDVEKPKTVVLTTGSAEGPHNTSSFEEKIATLGADDLEVSFSNRGGNIKKVTIKKFDYSLPVTQNLEIPGYENAEFTLDYQENNIIQYSLRQPAGKLIRKYELSPQGFVINASIEVEGNMSNLNMKELTGFSVDMSSVDKNKLSSEGTLFEYSASTGYSQVFRRGHAVSFSDKDIKTDSGIVNWVGFRDRYFCLVVKPLAKFDQYQIHPISAQKVALKFVAMVEEKAANSNPKRDFLIYYGPQDLKVMKAYNDGFEEIVSFSNFGLFDLCAKGIYNLVRLMHKVVPSWGTCIILISLLIYGALYPLTISGMMSMKKMQALQPQMAKIREQYKSNPQKLNQEVMTLYKVNKVNPFGGCLPLILQMPIFIGLYQVLWRSIFFKGSSFLWIKDLAEPDRLFIFPFSLPILGNEFNILPILVAVIMFFQQKFSTKNMVVTDPDQITQQKIMGIFFPIFLGFVFYHFASGLSLYFFTFYSLSTLTQIKMSKQTLVQST